MAARQIFILKFGIMSMKFIENGLHSYYSRIAHEEKTSRLLYSFSCKREKNAL